MPRELARLARARRRPQRTFEGKTRYARVVDVSDGDTVTVCTRLSYREPFYEYRLRIHGVNAPETRTRDALHKQAGKAVARWLRAHLAGKIVRVRFSDEDKFGRLCGRVVVGRVDHGRFVADHDLSERLVELRYAHRYCGTTRKQPFSPQELHHIVADIGD